jgi:serine protease AprX
MGYGSSESLAAPASLRKNLFPFAYKAGARVHSNSWGATLEGYGSDARDVDDFSYKNDDFLIVFAAGNDGDNGTFTIANPGNAKNCLTVRGFHS